MDGFGASGVEAARCATTVWLISYLSIVIVLPRALELVAVM